MLLGGGCPRGPYSGRAVVDEGSDLRCCCCCVCCVISTGCTRYLVDDISTLSANPDKLRKLDSKNLVPVHIVYCNILQSGLKGVLLLLDPFTSQASFEGKSTRSENPGGRLSCVSRVVYFLCATVLTCCEILRF